MRQGGSLANKGHDPVLVVDDTAFIRDMLDDCLQEHGFSSEQAGNIFEAILLLRSQAFSLIICDYEMPGGTGLELLEHVSTVYPSIPFILLTAHQEVELARRTIAEGGVDFLTKPFEPQQLIRVMEQAWARKERDRKQAENLTHEILTGTILALVEAVDAKDPHTAQHSQRVTALSLQLGQALGLSRERLSVLEFAAIVHDVGKIGIPEHILRKPGPLDPEEWDIVKGHPARGAEIVGRVGSLSEVASVIRHHHERLDGEGYPDGLAGRAIPEMSRIITLADVYEALTSARSYRPGLSDGQAREVMNSEMGGHFDPEFLQVFMGLSLESVAVEPSVSDHPSLFLRPRS
jgi:putative two-component system response regulator